MVLGQVGNDGHAHAHVDTCPDGDRQHGEEESTLGVGAGQMKVSFRNRFVGLWRTEEETTERRKGERT